MGEYMKNGIIAMLENATEWEIRLVWVFMAHLTKRGGDIIDERTANFQ